MIMKCKICGNEMLVDSKEEKEDTLIFHYKCANPKCPNYGYKEVKQKEDAEA